MSLQEDRMREKSSEKFLTKKMAQKVILVVLNPGGFNQKECLLRYESLYKCMATLLVDIKTRSQENGLLVKAIEVFLLSC